MEKLGPLCVAGGGVTSADTGKAMPNIKLPSGPATRPHVRVCPVGWKARTRADAGRLVSTVASS